MDIVTIIGLVAGAGTTFAALPDLVTMLKRRSSRGMNPRMAAITGSFQVLWVGYGILIGSTSVALWNIIAVVVNAFTVSASSSSDAVSVTGSTRSHPDRRPLPRRRSPWRRHPVRGAASAAG